MRYEELPGPLEGWSYDQTGVIHTANGYHTTAQQIESALWLLGCWASESRRWMIHSDESAGALRPLHEPERSQNNQKKRVGGEKEESTTKA